MRQDALSVVLVGAALGALMPLFACVVMWLTDETMVESFTYLIWFVAMSPALFTPPPHGIGMHIVIEAVWIILGALAALLFARRRRRREPQAG